MCERLYRMTFDVRIKAGQLDNRFFRQRKVSNKYYHIITWN